MKAIPIHDLQVGKTYQHYKNARMIITVLSKAVTPKGEHLLLKHAWIDEWQVCLTKTYLSSRWIEIFVEVPNEQNNPTA